jgi:hypothetical protein
VTNCSVMRRPATLNNERRARTHRRHHRFQLSPVRFGRDYRRRAGSGVLARRSRLEPAVYTGHRTTSGSSAAPIAASNRRHSDPRCRRHDGGTGWIFIGARARVGRAGGVRVAHRNSLFRVGGAEKLLPPDLLGVHTLAAGAGQGADEDNSSRKPGPWVADASLLPVPLRQVERRHVRFHRTAHLRPLDRGRGRLVR